MTKLLTTLSFMFVMFLGATAQEATSTEQTSGAQIEFETTTIDYGTIERYADGKRVFVFKNTGTEPLIISHAKGSCGCTVPTWPKEPIMPGQTGEINVKYATDRVGTFRKTVTLTTNAGTTPVVLVIKGTVLAAKPAETAPATPVAE